MDKRIFDKVHFIYSSKFNQSVTFDYESKLIQYIVSDELYEVRNKNAGMADKTGVKPSTKMNYNFVRNILLNEPFGEKKIGMVKTSDAKLFFIKLQEDGRRYSTVETVRGVLRPAFQMAVDDDVLIKNPFGLNWLE